MATVLINDFNSSMPHTTRGAGTKQPRFQCMAPQIAQRRSALHLSVMFLGILAVLCSACGDKDSEAVTPGIVGKWQVSANHIRIVYEVNGSRYDKTGVLDDQGGFTEFKADGTAVEKGDTYTYTLSGDQLTVNFGAYSKTGKVVLAGDQLTIL